MTLAAVIRAPKVATAPPEGGDAPAWWTEQSDRFWSTPVDNLLGDVALSVNIVDAWCGATVDTLRNEFVIPAQGGHTDYNGNEVYALKLDVETPAWVRLNDPSTPTGGDITLGTWADGRPKSAHGYGTITYDSTNDRTLLMSLPTQSVVNGDPSASIFEFDRTAIGTEPWFRGPLMELAGNTIFEGGVAAFDTSTGLAWVAFEGDSMLTSYNTATNADTTYAVSFTKGGYMIGAISPDRRAFAILGGSAGAQDQLACVDLDDPNGGEFFPTTSGSPPSNLMRGGIVWHPASAGFLCWTGGATIFKLAPPVGSISAGTWVWTSVSALGGATPTSFNANGTYGRFNIIPDMGDGRSALVVVSDVTEETYVYALPSGGV